MLGRRDVLFGVAGGNSGLLLFSRGVPGAYFGCTAVAGWGLNAIVLRS